VDEDNQKITQEKMFLIMFPDLNIPIRGQSRCKKINSQPLDEKGGKTDLITLNL
jgi:hypothetical protein